MTLRALGESRRPQRGSTGRHGAFTVAAAALTFALIRVNEDGWGPAQTLGALVAGVAVAAGAFVAVERRGGRADARPGAAAPPFVRRLVLIAAAAALDSPPSPA